MASAEFERRHRSGWFASILVDYSLDRQGSVMGAVDNSGVMQNTYSYKPYGGSNGTTGGRYNPYQYTGSYYDSQTSQYQMGARYYQQGNGRFTQQDPIGGGYTYTGDDPVNATDKTGLSWDDNEESAGFDTSDS